MQEAVHTYRSTEDKGTMDLQDAFVNMKWSMVMHHSAIQEVPSAPMVLVAIGHRWQVNNGCRQRLAGTPFPPGLILELSGHDTWRICQVDSRK